MPTDSRPNPDPTVFSKELVDKEIGHLRQLIEAAAVGEQRLNEERLRTVRQQVDRVEQVAAEQMASLRLQVAELKERQDRGEGRFSGQTALLAGLIALATLIVGLLVYLKP